MTEETERRDQDPVAASAEEVVEDYKPMEDPISK